MVTTIDKFGRVIIPKRIRERLGITSETTLNIDEDGKRIIIEPVPENEPLVEKDGILVFTGKLSIDLENYLSEEREQRLRSLLPEEKS